MDESQRLAEQIHRAVHGDAWHGPSWRELLDDVTPEEACRRPIPEAHTIAEILGHATTWNEVARRRLLGEAPDVSEADNWPAADSLSQETWDERRERFFASGRALEEAVRAFPAERLTEVRPGLDDIWYGLIAGQLQHLLYHAGQVPVLVRAVRATSR